MAIPSLTEDLNNEFIDTWYEVQADASDNILEARVVTALMKEKGLYKPQTGGRYIERTVKYGKKTARGFKKGDVLGLGDPDTETVALYNFKNIEADITRSFEDDRVNQGQYKRKDYVERKMVEARDALADLIESTLMTEAIHDSTATDGSELLPFSLFDFVPDLDAGIDYWDSSRLLGGITRDNTWMQHTDFTAPASGTNRKGTKTDPASLTMYEDMKNAYNTTGKQMSNPDMIITTQELYEIYDDIVSSKEQIIRQVSTNMANLGYDVLQFKGVPIVWSTDMTAGQMLMLNSNTFDIVYDPTAWFEMTSWERPARQLEQVAYIVNRMQLCGFNPRFNARIKWDTL